VDQALPALSNDVVSSLRHYTLAKQEVATSVRAAKLLFQAHGAQEAAERCQALVVQLAEDRFNLAVVGQFKRGKSTLMNAVLGRNLLPTGLLPLTSAITTLCYGSKERVMLNRKGWAWEQEVPLAQLETYITERGNPGNEKGWLKHAWSCRCPSCGAACTLSTRPASDRRATRIPRPLTRSCRR
jgi:dynamin family protein